jgi:hypothetical protein
MEARVQELSWVDSSGTGHDDATVTIDENGCVAVGHITAYLPQHFEIYYRIECDTDWRTRYVSVADTLTLRSLELHVTPDRHWVSDDGSVIPELDGALDVDISATPLSNSLPVRRLDLEVGESAEIVTAWIDVPALHVQADPQRYTRLLPNVYRYQSLDSDFTRDVVFDDDDFVVQYPGLFFRRGAPGLRAVPGTSRSAGSASSAGSARFGRGRRR